MGRNWRQRKEWFYEHADAIDALYQQHYAERAEKEGLVLNTKEFGRDCDECAGDCSICLEVLRNVAKAQLAKVLPRHEDKVAQAVKAERERIYKILETFTDSQDYLKSLRVMIIHNPDFKVQESKEEK